MPPPPNMKPWIAKAYNTWYSVSYNCQPLVIIPCMIQESSFSLSHLCLSCSVDWKRRCHVSSNQSAILNMKCILPCQIVRIHDCVVKEVHVAIPHRGYLWRTLILTKWLSVRFKFGDQNAYCHRCECIKPNW